MWSALPISQAWRCSRDCERRVFTHDVTESSGSGRRGRHELRASRPPDASARSQSDGATQRPSAVTRRACFRESYVRFSALGSRKHYLRDAFRQSPSIHEIGTLIRHKLLEMVDLHMILRLPTGIIFRSGRKASVIFFDNSAAS